MEHPFIPTLQDVLEYFKADAEGGLNKSDVEDRLTKFGLNELSGGEQASSLKILVKQTANAMTLVVSKHIFD